MFLKEHREIDLVPIAGPRELEELPRYKKATVENNDPLPLVRKTLNNGGKVLWVCNTVKRVMDAAGRAGDCHPLPSAVDHLVTSLAMRRRHRWTVVDEFRQV